MPDLRISALNTIGLPPANGLIPIVNPSDTTQTYNTTRTALLGTLQKTYTYLVFNSGSNYYAVNGRTSALELTDTNFTTLMNTLIETVSAAGGGIIHIAAGDYPVDEPILPKAKVWIRGEGIATRLYSVGTVTKGTAVFDGQGTLSELLEDITISDMLVDGSELTGTGDHVGTKGFFMRYLRRMRLFNLYVLDTPATGVGTDFLVDSLIDNVVAIGCGRRWRAGLLGFNGIGIGTIIGPADPFIISNCIARNSGNNGILIEQQNTVDGSTETKMMQVTGCLSYNNGNSGFQLSSLSQVSYTGCHAWSNKWGYKFDIASFTPTYRVFDVNITGCIAHSNEIGVYYAQNDVDCRNYNITGGSFNNNSQEGIYAIASRNINIVGAQVHDNGRTGVRVAPTSISSRNINISNNLIHRNGKNTTNTYDGIRVEVPNGATCDGLTIKGNQIYNPTGTSEQRYAISIAGTGTGAHTNTTIEGNDLRNNNSGPILMSTASTTCIIRNNVGYNPIGLSAVTLTGSPMTYTAGNTPEVLYITGGTVSSIVKSGTTLFTSTDCTVPLEPNQSVVITYSADPTIVKERI